MFPGSGRPLCPRPVPDPDLGWWGLGFPLCVHREAAENGPTAAMPYLAEEFTEIRRWVVVLQQRGDRLRHKEQASVRGSTRQGQGSELGLCQGGLALGKTRPRRRPGRPRWS